MKIEFLNETREKARLTRGWFRKQTTEVERRWCEKHGICWRYLTDGSKVPTKLDERLDHVRWKRGVQEREAAAAKLDAVYWKPVKQTHADPLPEARTVKS